MPASEDPGPERIGVAAARRIALAAQGFGRPRPTGPVTTRDLRRVLATVGLVQVDSVNVLTRAQYLPFFSRLGPYDTGLLDRLRDRAPRAVVEYWGHEASLVPVDLWPLFRFRMERARHESWGWMRRAAREHPELVAAVRAEVARHGPLTASELEARLMHEAGRPRTDWGWNWSLVKRVLEYLFWAGEISSAGRTPQFQRRYAVPHRVLPPAVTEAVGPAEEFEAFVALMELAARAHGIGSEQCLRDYARLRPEQARPALAALVARGLVREVRVEGWRRAAYLHRDARRPRRIDARALISPFDSLIWTRGRVRALFGFDYRLEIYVPRARRVHGYYVLPFLRGEELIGRVDLKADRVKGVLRVQALTWEPGRGGPADTADLEAELDLMAAWLTLPARTSANPGSSPQDRVRHTAPTPPSVSRGS